MSRSRKRTPVFTMTNASKGFDRKRANKSFRRAEKVALAQEDYDNCPEDIKEVSDVWSWACDGWHYFDKEGFIDGFYDKAMRK